MSQTPNLGLYTRGPIAWETEPAGAAASWDHDLNMALIDAAVAALQPGGGHAAVLLTPSADQTIAGAHALYINGGTFEPKTWNGTIAKYHDDDGIVTWNMVGGSFPNLYGDTRNNQVFRLGWNLANGGGPLVAGEPCIGIEMEDYWLASAGQLGTGQMEFHIPYVNAAAHVYRPLSFSADRATDFIDFGFQADRLTLLRRSDGSQLWQYMDGTQPQLLYNKGAVIAGTNADGSGTAWSINPVNGQVIFPLFTDTTFGTAGTQHAFSINAKLAQGPNAFVVNNENGAVFEVAPNGGVTAHSDWNIQSNNLIFGSGQQLRVQPGSLAMYSSGSIYWTADAHAYDAQDTGISRASAGVLSADGAVRGDSKGSIFGADFVRNSTPQFATYYDDFLVGPVGFGNFNVGTPSGGQAWYITDNGDPNHPGILRVNTGTASGSGLGYWNGNFGPNMGYPSWTLEGLVETSDLASGITFGFFSAQVWGTTNGACYFIYDSSVNGNWHIQTPNNNYDTGVAVAANTWAKLKLVGDVTGTQVACYINGTLVRTLTNSVEGFATGAGRFGFMAITRSAAAVLGDLDYVIYKRGPVTR